MSVSQAATPSSLVLISDSINGSGIFLAFSNFKIADWYDMAIPLNRSGARTFQSDFPVRRNVKGGGLQSYFESWKVLHCCGLESPRSASDALVK